MLDVCVAGHMFTICDLCNEKLFSKCLSAECQKNGRVKSQHDMSIIRKRRSRIGLNSRHSMSLNEALSDVKKEED